MRDTLRQVVKQRQRSSAPAEVLIREAEAAVSALRDTMMRHSP